MASYEIPPYMTQGSTLHGWLLEALSESQGWLQTQNPAGEWEKVMSLFDTGTNDVVDGMSNLGYDLVQRNARDIVASLSNFRHEGEFRPTFDEKLYDRAHRLTLVDKAWMQTNKIVNVRRQAIQYAVAFGTGYLVTDWNKRAHGTFGDIRERAFAPSDVTFVQLPKDHDIQQAYMTIIREELPINLAKRIYGNNAGVLTPDRGEPGWIQKGLQKVQRLMGGSPALAVAGMGQNNNKGAFPTVDIFHAYINDGAINETPLPIRMGVDGTNWSYTVPPLGGEIPLGIINPATGQQWTRPAEPEDCLMFPLRRYCIFTRTGILYDGSSPWWHGSTPVARIRFNDWAWEALGRSLMGQPMTMQQGIINVMRAVEDTIAVQLDPALLYDDQLVSEGFAKNFNPRMAGARAAANLNAGDVLKPPVAPGTYRLEGVTLEYLKQQEQRVNHLMGTPDLVAMAKAKQVPGQGTLEKLMEMAGPLVDDMVRAQEEPLQQLGEWRKALYFQFYTPGRIIKYVGPDPDQSYQFAIEDDLLIPATATRDESDRLKQVRAALSDFKFAVEESSINERHRMANKLALLQLKKAGVWIDDWTIAQAFQLHNYGPKPEGTRNMMERFVAQQHMTRELAEEVGGGQPGGQKGPGRPPTNQKPPQLASKDGGTRTTVKTS